MIRSLWCVLVALALCAPVLRGAAESKPPLALQEGEIDLESTQKETQSRESRGRKDTSTWIASLLSSVEKKGSRVPSELDDAGISYMTALYFYCSVKLGECAFVLDALLEGDVITSRSTGEVSCSTMNRFWKRWLAGDFDERAKYRVSAASGARLAHFNATDRPRYIRCRETVGEIASKPSNAEVRYAPDGSVYSAVARTKSLLDEISAKNLDIFDGVEPLSLD